MKKRVTLVKVTVGDLEEEGVPPVGVPLVDVLLTSKNYLQIAIDSFCL